MLTKKKILIYLKSFLRPEDVYNYQKAHTDRQNCYESKRQNKGGDKGQNQRGDDHIKNKIEGGFKDFGKNQKKEVEENEIENKLTQ